MKTTVEIADGILKDARKVAERQGTTLRALIEAGLRREIEERRRAGRFHLKRATFKGRGLRAELSSATWEQIRDLAYEGRNE